MDLKSLAQLGRIEKEFEVVPGVKVKFHTLSVVEQQKALASIPDNVLDDNARWAYMQQAILVHATDSVNDQKPELAALRELYGTMQYSILVEFFTRYLEVVADQNSILDELKKKMTPLPSESSGS
jgi:hypothetical protein